MRNLNSYIKLIGGPTEAARLLQVSRKTIWKWRTFGLPHTEWSGGTNHAERIAMICKANGFDVSAEKILKDSRR